MLELGPVTTFVELPYFQGWTSATLVRPSDDGLNDLGPLSFAEVTGSQRDRLGWPSGLGRHETSGLERSPAGVQESLQVAFTETGVSVRGWQWGPRFNMDDTPSHFSRKMASELATWMSAPT